MRRFAIPLEHVRIYQWLFERNSQCKQQLLPRRTMQLSAYMEQYRQLPTAAKPSFAHAAHAASASAFAFSSCSTASPKRQLSNSIHVRHASRFCAMHDQSLSQPDFDGRHL
jgi:hypothetical protein